MRGFFTLALTVLGVLGWVSLALKGVVHFVPVAQYIVHGFRAEYTVANYSGQDLVITPVCWPHGAREEFRTTFPLLATRSAFLFSWERRARWSVPTGSSLSIWYDSDDHDPKEIVAETADGQMVMQDERLALEIFSLRGWRPVPPEVRQLLADPPGLPLWIRRLVASLAVVAMAFVFVRSVRRLAATRRE